MRPEPCDEALRPEAFALHCFCCAVTRPSNLKLNTPETGQLSAYCSFNSAVGAAWQSGGSGSAWESDQPSRLMPDRTECTHRVAPQARGALAGSGIYTRRCTRCTPLCYGMLPDVNTPFKIRTTLNFNTVAASGNVLQQRGCTSGTTSVITAKSEGAFRRRGARIWYNIW